MKHQTKIIATLGPASSDEKSIEKLILAGVNMVRVNMSHGSHQDAINKVKLVRKCAAKHNQHVAVMFDLQGPKIRIAEFEHTQVLLREGDDFSLVVGMKEKGNEKQVGVTYGDLTKDCEKGDILLLDDGRIKLKVSQVSQKIIKTKILRGGLLKDKKGLNKYKGGISAKSLTAKDREDIKLAVRLDADYLAVSFVHSAEDIEMTRKYLKKNGGDQSIIAKIETADAVNNQKILKKIIIASDGAMMARGDLGIEIGQAELVGKQKNVIATCRSNDRVAITATQMMESMIEEGSPTRAEVFDVANAVLDGTDAVMLSAETAVGKHPHLVVKTMIQICRGADSYHGGFANVLSTEDDTSYLGKSLINRKIAQAAVRTANEIDRVAVLVSLTESGQTALYMSRINTTIPIYGLSSHPKALRKIALYRGVIPCYFKQPRRDVGMTVLDFMHKRKFLKKGERMVLTSGMHALESGGTNVMRVLEAAV